MFEFRFPKIGEAGSGGSVVRWLKNVGEFVKKDEPLLEVSTDKIATELASPQAGILAQQLVNEGDEVASGDVLALLEESSLEAFEEAPPKEEPCTFGEERVWLWRRSRSL